MGAALADPGRRCGGRLTQTEQRAGSEGRAAAQYRPSAWSAHGSFAFGAFIATFTIYSPQHAELSPRFLSGEKPAIHDWS